MSQNCKICNEIFNNGMELARHIKRKHNMSNIEYYDRFYKKEGDGFCKECGKPTKFYNINKGYASFCNNTCSNTYRYKHEDANHKETCIICNKQFIGIPNVASKALVFHIKNEHQLSSKEYYDKFIRKEKEGICPNCGKETTFRTLNEGYHTYCSYECKQKYMVNQEGTYTNELTKITERKNILKTVINTIKDKYFNFIKSEKKINFSDTIENEHKITQKNIKEEKTLKTLDETVTTIKTEIAASTERAEWIGTQQYKPVQECCNHYIKKQFYDIDEKQGFISNEWL